MRRGSVAEERPDLIPQWSPKNTQSPDKISCGSHQKVWWICSKGHEWEVQYKKYKTVHDHDLDMISESIETFTGFIDAKDPYTKVTPTVLPNIRRR